MKESTEQRTTEKPQWLELTEPEKQVHTYWMCLGESINLRVKRRFPWTRQNAVPADDRYFVMFHSKEEAEAHAAGGSSADLWQWDRGPAEPVNLQSIMSDARSNGRAGVAVCGWKGGGWQVLKSWPAGEPLMGEQL